MKALILSAADVKEAMTYWLNGTTFQDSVKVTDFIADGDNFRVVFEPTPSPLAGLSEDEMSFVTGDTPDV